MTTIDDLDEENMLKKLSKITSAYNFESRTVPNDEKFVIGTNYSKVVPTKEINSVKRDEFWKKEEEMEKARVASELEAKRLENLKIEDERLKREQREHLKRESLNKDLEAKKTIPAPREEIKAISPKKDKEDLPTKPRAEELRMERRKEAQELIGNKVNTAKMMFQEQAAQNAAKITASTTTQGPPAKPIRKTIHKAEPEPQPIPPQPQPQEIEKHEEIPAATVVVAEEIEQFSTIKRSPKTPTTPTDNNNGFILSDNETTKIVDNGKKQEEQKVEEQQPIVIAPLSTEIVEEQPQQQQQVEEEESDAHLLKAVALYDYQASDETEISFDPGKKLIIFLINFILFF